jgi:hypothetical protein
MWNAMLSLGVFSCVEVVYGNTESLRFERQLPDIVAELWWQKDAFG